MSDLDPMTQARFRGKPLAALTPDETREALVQALRRVRELEENAGFRVTSGHPIAVEGCSVNAVWPTSDGGMRIVTR